MEHSKEQTAVKTVVGDETLSRRRQRREEDHLRSLGRDLAPSAASAAARENRHANSFLPFTEK